MVFLDIKNPKKWANKISYMLEKYGTTRQINLEDIEAYNIERTSQHFVEIIFG